MARSVIKFDLSSIPSNAEIVSAELQVVTGKIDDPNTYPSAKYIVSVAKSDWDENTLTWFNMPDTLRTEAFNMGFAKSNATIKANLLTEVQGMISGEKDNFGFIFARGNPYNKRYTIPIHSSESVETSKRPKLMVTYLDVPTSVDDLHLNGSISKLMTVSYKGKSEFTVKNVTSGYFTAKIFTFNGKCIISEKRVAVSKGESSFTMPIGNLASGYYILSIESRKSKVNSSFVVK